MRVVMVISVPSNFGALELGSFHMKIHGYLGSVVSRKMNDLEHIFQQMTACND